MLIVRLNVVVQVLNCETERDGAGVDCETERGGAGVEWCAAVVVQVLIVRLNVIVQVLNGALLWWCRC